MYQILSLTDAPKQQFNALISGYDSATIYLEYKPQQYGWFMTVTWGTFVLSNERVSASPNLLRQFKDILPFGLMITGDESLDPSAIDSWVEKNQMYFLDAADVVEIEGIYVR